MPLTWFITLMTVCAGSQTCPAGPHPYYIQMPSQEVCQQVQVLNKGALASIECWARPTEPGAK